VVPGTGELNPRAAKDPADPADPARILQAFVVPGTGELNPRAGEGHAGKCLTDLLIRHQV